MKLFQSSTMRDRQSLFVVVLSALALFQLSSPTYSYADQPVMNEAPRWAGGYGFQFRHESYGSDELLRDDSEIDNPLGLSRYVEETWFEGVYTFDRSKRVTFKLPYVKQRRRVASGDSSEQQKNEGLGDLVLGVPLKLYENKGAFTHSFSITPSLRLPTGKTSGDFPISNGSWDYGVSLSYSSEDTRWSQLYDIFYWRDSDGKHGRRDGDEAGLNIDWGYRVYTNDPLNIGATLMLDISARYNERGDSLTTGASGGTRIHTGPIFAIFKDNIIFRVEYKFPAYEDTIGTSLCRGQELNVGIGAAF